MGGADVGVWDEGRRGARAAASSVVEFHEIPTFPESPILQEKNLKSSKASKVQWYTSGQSLNYSNSHARGYGRV
uniref:Uncharacterized protein n=1 Tax=Oryza sativa subsp. japonica TaxID=39947 RepID=Q69SX9_ORYSJ|nr:hypothetical protein [Oryza sativa Japonica Group]